MILKSRSRRRCYADGSDVCCYGVCEVVYSDGFVDIEVFRCWRLVFEVSHSVLVLYPSDSEERGVLVIA